MLLADVDTADAYQAYLVYVGTPGASFATFQSAQQKASYSLNTAIVGDLSSLTTSPDTTRLSAAVTVAQQVIALQTAQALPPPAVSPCYPSWVCMQSVQHRCARCGRYLQHTRHMAMLHRCVCG